jgi:hypothetical protein
MAITEACVERYWSDDLVAISFHTKATGWLEMDVPAERLPCGAGVGDRFRITLFTDSLGRVRNWSVEPDTQLSRSETLPAQSRPQPPASWSDSAEVDRYIRELDAVFAPQDKSQGDMEVPS